jgi:uncharacterized 2Fe-2S/4Fe-4S cluster protein (DUF4445 family)
VTFIETAAEPDFQIRFAEALSFPHKRHKFSSINHLIRDERFQHLIGDDQNRRVKFDR